MPHCDPELLALGDSAEPADLAHLDTCSECACELQALTAVVRTGRSGRPDPALVAPPDRVWNAIAAELGLSQAPARRRWSRTTGLVAAAAAVIGLVVGGTTTWLVTRNATTEQVVASADLHPLRAPSASGTAVVSSQDSLRRITVRVSGLNVRPDAFYEVWLLDRGADRLVALGVLGPSETGTYVIAASLDLGQYSVVDVSLQPERQPRPLRQQRRPWNPRLVVRVRSGHRADGPEVLRQSSLREVRVRHREVATLAPARSPRVADQEP